MPTLEHEKTRLLLLWGAWLSASLLHSSFPFAGFLISLSDFEMLIWMSGSSLRWSLHFPLTSPSLCRSLVGVMRLNRSAWLELNYSQSRLPWILLNRCSSLMDYLSLRGKLLVFSNHTVIPLEGSYHKLTISSLFQSCCPYLKAFTVR